MPGALKNRVRHRHGWRISPRPMTYRKKFSVSHWIGWRTKQFRISVNSALHGSWNQLGYPTKWNTGNINVQYVIESDDGRNILRYTICPNDSPLQVPNVEFPVLANDYLTTNQSSIPTLSLHVVWYRFCHPVQWRTGWDRPVRHWFGWQTDSWYHWYYSWYHGSVNGL